MIKFDLLTPGNFDERFENGRRIYRTPEGKIYPSVTTVLGEMVEKGDGFLKWKERVGTEEAKRVAGVAATRGKAVHDMVEKFLKGVPNPTEGHNIINVDLFKKIRPHLEKNLGTVYGVELPLYSNVLRTAGRTDLIGTWDNDLAIIDIKTSTNAKKEEWILNYFMQETTYSCCLLENYNMAAKKIVTLITNLYDDPQIFIHDTKEYLKEVINTFKAYHKKHGR